MPSKETSLELITSQIQDLSKLERLPLPKKINIWGIQEAGERFFRFALDNNIEVSRVFDSNKEKQGTFWNGHKVEAPELGDNLTIICAYNTWNHPGLSSIDSIDMWDFLVRFRIMNWHTWNCFSNDYKHFNQNLNGYASILNRCYNQESKEELLKQIGARYGLKQYYPNNRSTNSEYSLSKYFQSHEELRVVDAGAFCGDTVDRFLNLAKSLQKKIQILAIEPDLYNFTTLSKYVWDKTNVFVLNGILDSEFGISEFVSLGKQTSSPSNKGSNTKHYVTNIPLDSIKDSFKPTHVKMDIEGFESQALSGARELINMNSTIFILACYHKIDDLISLTSFFGSDYLFGFESHAQRPWDSTLYALPRQLI